MHCAEDSSTYVAARSLCHRDGQAHGPAEGTEAHMYAADVTQQVLQAKAWQAEEARRLAGVKHVDDEEAKVLLQPEDVAVGAVQHLQGACVAEALGEGGAHMGPHGNDIDDEVL